MPTKVSNNVESAKKGDGKFCRRIAGDGATDHFFWESWYFVKLYFVLSLQFLH